MMRTFWVLSCTVLSACISTARPGPHAPPGEAAKVEFPLDLPKQGLRHLQGNMASAILLAMEDFLTADTRPDPLARREEACLSRREAYNVTAAPASEGVMLVRFIVNLDICDPGESIVDVTTYAVDVKTMRILAIEGRSRPRDTVPPSTGS